VSRYSALDGVTGAWGDIIWRKSYGRYLVYVGERCVGEVWPMTLGWMAISYAPAERLRGLRGVAGFGTRWAATEYILDVGVRPPRED
jgi:hypothetical protein